MAPSGLAKLSVTVMRSLRCGSRDPNRLAFIVAVHGPTQLLRAASWPSCCSRQSRAELEPVLSRLFNAASTCVTSAAPEGFGALGSKTNARSPPWPSPLMSPPTTGVNRSPDDTRANVVSATRPLKNPRAAWKEN